MHIQPLISEKICKTKCFTVRLNFENELKSTVWGSEFHQFITRSLKKSFTLSCLNQSEFHQFITRSLKKSFTLSCLNQHNFVDFVFIKTKQSRCVLFWRAL